MPVLFVNQNRIIDMFLYKILHSLCLTHKVVISGYRWLGGALSNIFQVWYLLPGYKKSLYKNGINYINLRKDLHGNLGNFDLNSRIRTKEIYDVLYYQDEIIDYFKNDFKVYYILDTERQQKNALLFSRAKRLHLILILILGNFFVLYFYHKYQIVILNYYKLNFPIILIPLFLVTYLCDKNNPFAETYWGSLNQNLITKESLQIIIQKIMDKILR